MVDVSLRGGDGGNGSPRRGRTTVRRRIAGVPGALPNVRSIIGALLCVSAALLAWYATTGRADEPMRPLVVATRDISAGMLVTVDDLRVDEVVITPELRVRTFAAPDEVIGRVALGPIASGDPILRSGTDDNDARVPKRQFSLSLPVAAAVGGSLQSGDTVDILATRELDGADATMTLARGILVSRVTGNDPNVVSPTGDRLITFAVPADLNVETIINASATGKVHLVRTTGTTGTPGAASPASASPAPPATAPADPATTEVAP